MDRTSESDKMHSRESKEVRREIGDSLLEISDPWRLAESNRKALFKNGPGTYGARTHLLV